MPFIPHTQTDVDEMLAQIGVDKIDALFDEIPAHLVSDRLDKVPEGMSEMAMLQYMAQRAEQDQGYTCFLGGGSYDHHIPSAVWDLTTRGEFMTAYTPYQAEASQGTLQLIYGPNHDGLANGYGCLQCLSVRRRQRLGRSGVDGG